MKKLTALIISIIWVQGLYALNEPYYDPSAEVTIEGKITEINVSPPADEGDTLLKLKVHTKSGKEIEVYVCPGEYVKVVNPKTTVEVSPGEEVNVSTPKTEIEVKPGENVHITSPGAEIYVEIPGERKFHLRVGEQIKIKGAKVKNHKGETVIAREIIRNKEQLRLRDKAGFPMWFRYRERVRMKYEPDKEMKMKGRVVEIKETTPPRGFYPVMEATIETPGGNRIRVILGPSWYMEESIKIGDKIEVTGSFVKTKEGEVMICRELKNERLNLHLELRNREGSPMWMGERPHRGMEEGHMGEGHMGEGFGPRWK